MSSLRLRVFPSSGRCAGDHMWHGATGRCRERPFSTSPSGVGIDRLRNRRHGADRSSPAARLHLGL